jgi:hypothetical protein
LFFAVKTKQPMRAAAADVLEITLTVLLHE